MFADLISTLICAASDDPSQVERNVALAAPLMMGWLGMGAVVIGAAVGCGLFALAAAPARHARAALRAADRPIASFALGLVVLVPLVLLAIALVRHHVPGRNLVGLIAAYALALGWSVAARALGERAAPAAGAVVQTLIGLVAILPPCLLIVGAAPRPLIVGLPVALVAAPLGLGAWLLARRDAP